MTLLAHHMEPEHVPVLLVFLAVGIWAGWQLVGVALKQLDRTAGRTRTPAP
jgi:hypothetical protein